MAQVKLSDFVFDYLNKAYQVDKLFMIAGGGAMHLNDSVGKNKNISYLCNHHEQASAIGAEGFARIAQKMAVVVVTTGPGGTNTLTGVIGQWLDTVPVLYISGQVKYETTTASCSNLNLRQLGDQEINIVDIVKPVTKYASMVTNPLEIKQKLDEAIYWANEGRKGPVWLDIPLNVQGATIDTENLIEFVPPLKETLPFETELQDLIDSIEKSERPVIIAGNGIRVAGAADDFLHLLAHYKIPVVSSFLACDLIPSDHPLYIGRLGTIGNRPGNFAVQNSDLLICIGTRNNIRQISYNWKAFAREAKKVVIDIDPAELKKPTLQIDLPIVADAKLFIQKWIQKAELLVPKDFSQWIQWNQERKTKYSAFLPEYKTVKEGVHPYYLLFELTKLLKENDIVVTGNATPSIVYFQLGEIKKNQRVLWNSGCAAMGYDLPAAIGAAFASNGKREVICLAGDGSLQMNIQELQTLVQHQLPIKLFVLDNQGYISIKQTQENFFQGRLTACGTSSGVSFPDFAKLAEAYGLPTLVIDQHEGLSQKLQNVLHTSGPIVCHVKLRTDYKFLPKTASVQKADGSMVSRPLEDMYPFLDREEFLQNLLIHPLNE
ncbi:MAG: thiamine pyrophosphate-binding protein [Bacteroidales bacterium]